MRSLPILFLPLVTGCALQAPTDALRLPPESAQVRVEQTRQYEGVSEANLLVAAANVLQDLGFTIDETEARLGLIVASKERSAVSNRQVTGSVLLALFTGVSVPWDSKQIIRASLVTQPLGSEPTDAHRVRVTFQRIVWDVEKNVSRAESIQDQELYQQFHERLSKSVFIQSNAL